MLGLIFRTWTDWTIGYCWKNALDHLGIPYVHLSSKTRLVADTGRLAECDAVLAIDDGFGWKSTPEVPLPVFTCPSAYYAVDLHNSIHDYDLGQFTHVFCAQKTLGVDLLDKHYAMDSEWMPLAYDHIGVPYQKQGVRDLDVAIVACWGTEDRRTIRDRIRFRYDGFADTAFWEEMGLIYSKAKIGVNSAGLKMGGGERAEPDHTNMRLFEVMGCGAMLLTQKLDVPDLDDIPHLTAGEHYVTWKRQRGIRALDELWNKVDYYLEHGRQRYAIARAGRAAVMNWHTYVHRVERVLEVLGI